MDSVCLSPHCVCDLVGMQGNSVGVSVIFIFSAFSYLLSPPPPPPPNINGAGRADASRGEDSGAREVVGEFEGSGVAEFPPTPLNVHMMLKKALPINQPRTPSPPVTISPASPPYTQVTINKGYYMCMYIYSGTSK